MTDRTCAVPGCNNIYRAKDYCGTHYNQFRVAPGQRHKKRAVACVVCGTVVVRLPRGKIRPTCSPYCRTILQWGAPSDGAGYDRDERARSRALRLGAAHVELVSISAVFERDNWTCYICHRPVDPDADCYQLNSATIDHVIALAQGGAHTMDNTRCCCLECNSLKGEYVDKVTA